MNRKAKTFAVLGLLVIGLMLTFPPWAVSNVQTGNPEFIGYSLFTGPPESSPFSFQPNTMIFKRRLAFQIGISVIVTAVFTIIAMDPDTRGGLFRYPEE